MGVIEQLNVTQIIVGLATLGVALGVGIILPPTFLRFVLKDWIMWRDRVEKKLDRLQPEHVLKIEGFDPARLESHYQGLHDLRGKVAKNELSLAAVDRKVEDHELRLRAVERKA